MADMNADPRWIVTLTEAVILAGGVKTGQFARASDTGRFFQRSVDGGAFHLVSSPIHNDLAIRDENDSHPISAITDLTTALDEKLDTDDLDSNMVPDSSTVGGDTVADSLEVIVESQEPFDISKSDGTMYWAKFLTITRTGSYPLCDMRIDYVGRLGFSGTLVVGQRGGEWDFSSTTIKNLIAAVDDAPEFCAVETADIISVYSRQLRTYQASKARVVTNNLNHVTLDWGFDNVGTETPSGALMETVYIMPNSDLSTLTALERAALGSQAFAAIEDITLDRAVENGSTTTRSITVGTVNTFGVQIPHLTTPDKKVLGGGNDVVWVGNVILSKLILETFTGIIESYTKRDTPTGEKELVQLCAMLKNTTLDAVLKNSNVSSEFIDIKAPTGFARVEMGSSEFGTYTLVVTSASKVRTSLGGGSLSFSSPNPAVYDIGGVYPLDVKLAQSPNTAIERAALGEKALVAREDLSIYTTPWEDVVPSTGYDLRDVAPLRVAIGSNGNLYARGRLTVTSGTVDTSSNFQVCTIPPEFYPSTTSWGVAILSHSTGRGTIPCYISDNGVLTISIEPSGGPRSVSEIIVEHMFIINI